MLSVYPDYYPRFKCISSACRHNCCIGWEIDIDPDTMAKYAGLGGEMGARLSKSIDRDGDTPHFILAENERCPFLNDDNLCDLILFGGEGMLCRICADHPRFRNELGDRVEIGLGLCCEAAARLILGRTEAMHLVVRGTQGEPDDYAAALIALRDRLLDAAQDRRISLDARMDAILNLCAARLPKRTWRQWAEFYMTLERLDPRWTEVLEQLRDDIDRVDTAAFDEYMAGREHEYEQLLTYYIYRHFAAAYDDGDIVSKAAFAVLSTRFLYTLGACHFAVKGSFTFEDQVEYARMYSSEVEYSQENLDAMFDELM